MTAHDDLERRLREAFEAKASQVTPESLDRDRESDFERQLATTAARRGPRRGVLAGAGLLAAAAAAAGVLALTIQPDDNGRVVDAARTVTQSSSVTAPTSAPTASGSTGMTQPTQGTQRTAQPGPQQPQGSTTTAPSPDRATPTTTQSAPSPTTSSAEPSPSSEPVSPSAAGSTPDRSIQLAPRAAAPPLMSSDLPQASGLAPDVTYDGPVPLFATLEDGSGATYSIPMPAGTKWLVINGSGPRYRILSAPSSIADYWAAALPGQGWVQSGAGWTFPGTSYTVSLSGDVVFAGYGG
ncbi:hypothetical protein [Flexivirga meconopsidis]|uniref:hypothetical protein n=1 Tax=Flexivirga meconopsidis TaxID=2977121 RepID=UPI002240BAD7|nr:hypothetical protein [Flexivirga meconopsidis]